MSEQVLLLKIQGKEFPNPSEYRVEQEPIGEFSRNAAGEMVGDLIAMKTKITCGWTMLEGHFFKDLLAVVTPFFVTVSYFDPAVEAHSEGAFYLSPMGGKLALLKEEESWWRDVSFQLLER